MGNYFPRTKELGISPFVPLWMRWRFFIYDIVTITNSGPLLFYTSCFGFLALLVYMLIWKYLAIPFLLISLYLFFITVKDFISNVVLKGKEEIPESNEELSPIQLIRARKSVRAYQRRKLTKEHKEFVLREIQSEDLHPEVRIEYVESRFNCILITDCYQFLVVIMPKKYQDIHLVNIGRTVQGMLFNFVKLGMSTCWVGGFRGYEVIRELEGYDVDRDHVAVVIAIGYQSKYVPAAVHHTNTTMSQTRKEAKELFFEDEWGKPLNMKKDSKAVEKVFEWTRWSPSASNDQFTRIVKIGDRFHFYRYGHSQYYSVLCHGISMKNWEATSEALDLSGRWVSDDDPNIEVPKNAYYMRTWVPRG